MNKEYLDLFKNINEHKDLGKKPIKEKNYNDLQSINETPDVSKFKINENINDGWNIQFETETRVNGIRQSNNPYEQRQSRRQVREDLNGLNKYIEEDKTQQITKQNQLNEVFDLKNVSVVTLEMFESIRRAAMIQIANKI